ncbi:biotin--[acetyl-CoA-carboxylase] ligase [Pelomonas sp. CA6]|uniref:biotin--[acetyl-CoA-carboxylase] ligase n=1 Tax=Pelomonas sp. CA6 TaxID=2907999 RepID=UPI0035A86B7A
MSLSDTLDAELLPMQEHQHWGVEALWQDLEPILPGLSIEVLARVESTNAALVERVRTEGRGRDAPYGRRQHDLQPCLLIAEHQTHGRGRLGRQWYSSVGASLTFSLSLPLNVADWSGLSLVVGCAIAEALDPLPPGQAPRLQLKWPNDLWLDGRKLGGILIETVPAGPTRMGVIGIGLNVSERARVAEGLLGTGFACLQELHPGITPPRALARLAPGLLRALADFPNQGFAGWRERFAARDLLRDRPLISGAQEGRGAGVNERGELLIQTAQGLQAVAGGEVSVRLAAAPGPQAG